MSKSFSFNRQEFAGSLGDLGTLLPIAIAMVMVNGLDPAGVFFSIGLFYIFSGYYFKVTVPVQPMKVIGAYAIATAMEPGQILASSLLMSFLLLLLGVTGAIETLKKLTPTNVIRGVQFSTGALLVSGGVQFILGTSKFQQIQSAAEPFLAYQNFGPVQVGIIIGFAGVLVTLFLLDSKRFPAGLVLVLGGALLGLILGARVSLAGLFTAIHLPEILPFGLPGKVDFTFALFVLVLPQIPMTLGNAVLAYTDLSEKYFAEQSSKVTNRSACISMGCANLLTSLLGGMPLCHGAGGLAAHYRFGARTAGSNMMIGALFLIGVLILGDRIVEFFNIIPMSILGVLLVFAGAQLTMTIMDLKTRKDFFVVSIILGITLGSNLAAGFICGMILSILLKSKKLSV